MNSTVFCTTGLLRSGTSLVAQAIHLAGVDFGRESELLPPQPGFNDEGFYEHTRLIDFNYRLLESLDRNEWFSTRPLPDGWWLDAKLKPAKDDLKRLLIAEFSGKPAWGWKDPRAAILLPLWFEVLEELGAEIRIVVPVRNPLDVAASIARTWALPRSQVLRLWLRNMLSIREAVRNRPHLFVSYDRLLEHPETEAARLQAFIGPTANPDLPAAVRAAIRPSLRHSHSQIEELEAVAGTEVSTLYRDCLGLADSSGPAPLVASLDQYRRLAALVDFWRCDKPAVWLDSCLACDYGQGFDLPDTRVERLIPHSPDLQFDMVYPLPKPGPQRLLFHPCSEKFARCQIEAIEMDNGKTITISRCNASGEVQGWDVFGGVIPTYEFSGNFSGLSSIRIQGRLDVAVPSDNPEDQRWARILSSC